MRVTTLFFVHAPSVNVKANYYSDVLFSQQMFPAIKSVAGDTFT